MVVHIHKHTITSKMLYNKTCTFYLFIFLENRRPKLDCCITVSSCNPQSNVVFNAVIEQLKLLEFLHLLKEPSATAFSFSLDCSFLSSFL